MSGKIPEFPKKVIVFFNQETEMFDCVDDDESQPALRSDERHYVPAFELEAAQEMARRWEASARKAGEALIEATQKLKTGATLCSHGVPTDMTCCWCAEVNRS